MNLKSIITLRNQTNYNVHLRKKTLNESMKWFSDPLFVGFSGITFSYIAMADIFGCPVGHSSSFRNLHISISHSLIISHKSKVLCAFPYNTKA